MFAARGSRSNEKVLPELLTLSHHSNVRQPLSAASHQFAQSEPCTVHGRYGGLESRGSAGIRQLCNIARHNVVIICSNLPCFLLVDAYSDDIMTSGVAPLIGLALTLEISLEFSCVHPARKFSIVNLPQSLVQISI